jgi:small subunit ribosomal protein S14
MNSRLTECSCWYLREAAAGGEAYAGDYLRRAGPGAGAGCSGYFDYEADRALYKALVSDQSLAYGVRQQAARLFETEVPRDSAAHRVRNRCALTGRPRGVYRWCRLSRLMFRKLASHGSMPGVTKASW